MFAAGVLVQSITLTIAVPSSGSAVTPASWPPSAMSVRLASPCCEYSLTSCGGRASTAGVKPSAETS
jgi:hypothetical protein